MSRRKRLARILLLVTTLIGMPAAAMDAEGRLRVLLITGGHSFERECYLDVFRANPEIDVTHLEHTKGTADAWDRADLSRCDVVVLYDMPRTITAAQQARFLELFDRGIGLVATHHALVSYQSWPEYERIIGGRYIETAAKGGDPAATPSGYEHDVEIPVVVAARDHPITAGLCDFTLCDEIYWGFRVGADVTPLLTTPQPKSGNPLAWCRTEGRSRVVYVLLGHGPSAYGNAHFRRLLASSIRWAGRR